VLYFDQRVKNDEMKSLIGKYGKPEEIYNDPSSKEILELHQNRA